MFPELLQALMTVLGGNLVSKVANSDGNILSGLSQFVQNIGSWISRPEIWNQLGENVGQGLNNLTGASANNQFNHQEALLSREHATAEREATQIYNSREAQIARDFQLEYDSTAMQRRVADMQAAGLNPMAMFAQGSPALGTSSGASAATSSTGSSASASGSGNSASALSGFVRALATLVRSAK